jgi:hypothetical protein
MLSSASFHKISVTELERAPTSPGVYAWYPSFTIGALDWKKQLDESEKDIGKTNFTQLLAKQTRRFSPPPLRASVRGSFRDAWSGRLTVDRFEKYADAIHVGLEGQESDEFQFPAESINRILDREKQRGRLAKLITEIASPVLISPLYIGRAENLRKRLKEHFSDLEKWSQAVRRDPSYRQNLWDQLFVEKNNKKIPDIFATRAVACGFSPDSLEVYVLDIKEEFDLPFDQASDLAATFEWLINTWCRPILGRA